MLGGNMFEGAANLECAGSPGNLGPEKEAPWGLGGACAEGVAGAELDVRVWCRQSLGSLSRQAGCRESGGGRQCGLVICSGSLIMPATFAPRGTTLWSGEMFLESEVSESGVAHLSARERLSSSSASSTSTLQSLTALTSLLDTLLALSILCRSPLHDDDMLTWLLSGFSPGTLTLITSLLKVTSRSLLSLMSRGSASSRSPRWNRGGKLVLTSADLGLPDGGFLLGSQSSLSLFLLTLSCLDQPSRSLESFLKPLSRSLLSPLWSRVSLCSCLFWLFLWPPLPNVAPGGEGVLLTVLRGPRP